MICLTCLLHRFQNFPGGSCPETNRFLQCLDLLPNNTKLSLGTNYVTLGVHKTTNHDKIEDLMYILFALDVHKMVNIFGNHCIKMFRV